MDILIPILVGAGCLLGGLFLGYRYRKSIAEAKIGRAEDSVRKLIDEAQKRAEVIKKETVLEAQDEVHNLRSEFDKEARERRAEFNRTERRLNQKEETLERKLDSVLQKEEQLERKNRDVAKVREELETVQEQQMQQLERISNMTAEDAKGMLLEKVESEA